MFKTYVGNPYESFKSGDIILVTTNGMVKKDGKAVMGRGSAKFARDTFAVDEKLGKLLKKYGNRAMPLGKFTYQNKELTLMTFPTKHNWRDKSDIDLIRTSAEQVLELANKYHLKKLYLPMPGCSNGGLNWKDVKVLLSILDDRFTVYSLNKEDFN